MSVWRLRLHAQSWTAEQINEDGTENLPIAMTPGQTFVVREDEPGAAQWRAGMMTDVIPAPLEGAARWQLFSDEELGWLALGLSVAEGEGLLPPRDGSAEGFAAFQTTLDSADENRDGT